jgi:hypothetical protein
MRTAAEIVQAHRTETMSKPPILREVLKKITPDPPRGASEASSARFRSHAPVCEANRQLAAIGRDRTAGPW